MMCTNVLDISSTITIKLRKRHITNSYLNHSFPADRWQTLLSENIALQNCVNDVFITRWNADDEEEVKRADNALFIKKKLLYVISEIHCLGLKHLREIRNAVHQSTQALLQLIAGQYAKKYASTSLWEVCLKLDAK